jgi:hypothetical protein
MHVIHFLLYFLGSYPEFGRQNCRFYQQRARGLFLTSFAFRRCTLEEPGSWRSAPRDAFVLGLGALPGTFSLEHRHIYFGYAFKNQFGWENLLGRYLRGGGKLLDIEYIVDDAGRRLASFGNTAGYIGMAAGILAWFVTQPLSSSQAAFRSLILIYRTGVVRNCSSRTLRFLLT